MKAAARPVKEGFVPFRGHNIWYRIEGEGELSGKLPLLRTRGEITWISADCSRQFELKRVIQAGKH